MFKLTIKNNFLNLFLFLSLLLIIIFVYIFNSKNKNSIKEPLQNFDASYVSYDINTGFPYKIKQQDDADLSGLLTTQFYTANDFGGGAKHYDNDEIEKDIKYFNNVTHIMIGYIRKNMLPKSYKVEEPDDTDE